MAKKSCKMFGLKYPASDKIKNRTSTIARAMACSLTPRIPASDDDIDKMVRILNINPNEPTCAYCGRKATHLDHLHSLIDDIQPSGYCTEPANLVPCCEKCNQPKGALHWRDYMRNRIDLTNTDGKVEERIQYLENLSLKMPPLRYDFKNMEGFQEVWDEYNKLKSALISTQNKIDIFIENNKTAFVFAEKE